MRSTVNGARTKGSTQKITNNTRIFGIMGGLAPQRNVRVSTLRGYRQGHANLKQRIPLAPGPGLNYMLSNNLLSRNPQCSGGVGRMAIFAGRGRQSLHYRAVETLQSITENNNETLTIMDSSPAFMDSSLAFMDSSPAFMDSSLAFMDSCMIENNIYIIGGGIAPGWYSTNICNIYNIKQNTWGQISPMKIKRIGHGVVVSDDKKYIYTLGGSTGFASLLDAPPSTYTCILNSCEKYDIASNSWSSITPMLNKKVLHGTVQTNGKIYIIGGNIEQCSGESNGLTNTCEMYDPGSDTWKQISAMNQKRAGSGVVTYGKYIYALGGNINLHTILNPTGLSDITDTCEVYDISMNRWSLIAPLTTARCLHQAVQINGIIYIIGGETTGGVTNTCEKYDIIKSTWTAFTSMSTARASHTVVANENYIYVFGGWNKGDYGQFYTLNSVEVYDIQNNKWYSSNNTISPYKNNNVPRIIKYINDIGQTNKEASIFVQADGTDGISFYDTLKQITYYRKHFDISLNYFDKIIIFAANMDYGQDVSSSQGTNCWQQDNGCKPYITLSLNNTLNVFFTDSKDTNYKLLQQLRKAGSKIYLSILGNHNSGGMGGFDTKSSAEYFLSSIMNVLSSFNINKNFNNLIDGLVIDDEYADTNARCVGCESYKNFGDAVNSIRSAAGPRWCNDIGLTWNNGPPSPPTTSIDDILNPLGLTPQFKFNFIIPTAYRPGAASIPEQLCNPPLESSVYNVGIGCQQKCSDTKCNQLYQTYPMNKWFFTIQLEPMWTEDQYNSSLSIGGLQDKMGISFFTYKYNKNKIEDSSLMILNNYLKLYGMEYIFNNT